MKNVENLSDDIEILHPSCEGLFQRLVTMHAYDTVPYFLIVTLLDATEQFDSNPLFSTLPQSRHNLCNSLLFQFAWFQVVDIFLIVFAGLLLTGLLGNSSLPAITIIDSKRFNGSMRQLRSIIRLCFAADEASTVGFATITRLWVCSISIDVVIEDEFFPGLDLAFHEDAHAKFVTNNPFVHKTVGIARVIAKSSEIALFSRIDEFAFCEGHEIEMFYAFFVVLNHAASERAFINDFANVFEDEFTRYHVLVCAKTIALLLSLDYRHVGILFSEEPLVLTLSPTAAVTATLHFGRAIDAIRVFSTSMIGSCDGIYASG